MKSDLLFDYLENIESANDGEFDSGIVNCGITKQYYEISDAKESQEYDKPIGKYELISTNNLLCVSDEYLLAVENALYNTLKKFVGDVSEKDNVLIVGLGNRHIASDSLGAKVVSKINITINNKHLPRVMAINPSVMGLTGIETFDIVDGVVHNVCATHLILIDSLCAGAVNRLGRSIQVTNTGLCPGGGVGNKRKCIDTSLTSKVFSIGIPLLIYASTFVSDTLQNNGIEMDAIDSIMQKCTKTHKNSDIIDICKALKKVKNDDVDSMIVAFKDIDEYVEIVSNIVAGAINKLMGTTH